MLYPNPNEITFLGYKASYWAELHRLAQTNRLEHTIEEVAHWRARALHAEGTLQEIKRLADARPD